MITYFPEEVVLKVGIPEVFTFPFFYEPHPLTEYAANQLQTYLESDFTKEHNFGLDKDKDGLPIGKMFGVLVVQDSAGKLGYLWAHSGKLAGSNENEKFVPPVFDMLTENSFFLKEVEFINAINAEVETIEKNINYQELKKKQETYLSESKVEIEAFREEMRQNKAKRKEKRNQQKTVLSAEEYANFESELNKRSIYDKKLLAQLLEKWKITIDQNTLSLQVFQDRLDFLKNDRKAKSAELQKQLFEQYSFLNQYGKTKSLYDIFSKTVFGKPPAAAGECATPKLLQYAFLNELKPLAMGEFWWGASPKSEVRKHKQYYPACTGKCEPILKHMLEGIETEANPFIINHGEGKNLEIVYEDEQLVVVNKPENMLSVPGINIQDSVIARLKSTWKTIEPIVIHRLDMATSGLLVVAKTAEAHKFIQRQFLNRKVIKRYTALLSKVLDESEGEIDLPLRGNLDDRPRQMVCFEHGKKSITKWKAVEKTNSTTRVHFWPLTGRTHQLRMHAAHELGLNAPIVGDDLYGITSNRLHLHAAYIEFIHPETKQKVSFERKETF